MIAAKKGVDTMRRILCLVLALAVGLCLLAGCKKGGRIAENVPTFPQITEPEFIMPTAQEVEAQLRQDAYPQSSSLLSLVGPEVTFSDFVITEDTVTFTLTAPHFGDLLIQWYDSIDTLEPGDLEDQVVNNLKKDCVSTEFSLNYTRQGDQLLFAYTDPYLNAAGCGLREYYNHIHAAILEEMGVDGL